VLHVNVIHYSIPKCISIAVHSYDINRKRIIALVAQQHISYVLRIFLKNLQTVLTFSRSQIKVVKCLLHTKPMLL